MTVCIYLFGALQLAERGRDIALPGGKPRELLAYLALHPRRRHSRESLADVLFGDAPAHRARRNLTDALHRLRQALPEQLIDASNEHIGLNYADAWADVWEFEASGDLARSLDLYRGDLLEEFDSFWLLNARAHLRDLFLLRVESHCRQLMDTGRTAQAMDAARRWIAIESMSESAYVTLMQLCAGMGRHTVALQHYQQLVDTLARELNTTPSSATQSLAELIRCEAEARVESAATCPPFVGRRHERQLLAQLADRTCDGSGGIVLINGAEGIGKTRLLEAFAETALWRNMLVAQGGATRPHNSMPCSPLATALQDAISAPRLDMLREAFVRHLDPATQALIAAWAPGLLPARSRTMSECAGATSQPVNDLALSACTAMAECVMLVADARPLVLLLDDVQFADTCFWNVLRLLAPAIESHRILIVAAGQLDDLRLAPEVRGVLTLLEGECGVTQLRLSGLLPIECERLARSVGKLYDTGDLDAVYLHTQGNPRFAIECMRNPETAIASFQASISQRLGALSSNARQALEAAAIIGNDIAFSLWQSVCEVDLLKVIDELILARHLEETQHRYAFTHDMTRRYIRESMAQSLRRVLHARAAAALAQQQADPIDIAVHHEHAGQWLEASRHRSAAGEAAERACEFAVALEQYTQALADIRLSDSHATGDARDRAELALLCKRHRMLAVLLRVDEQHDSLRDIERLAQALNESAAHSFVCQARQAQDDDEPSLTDLDRAGAPTDSDWARALALSDAGATARRSSHFDFAIACFGEAFVLFGRCGDARSALIAGCEWARCFADCGRHTDARIVLDRVSAFQTSLRLPEQAAIRLHVMALAVETATLASDCGAVDAYVHALEAAAAHARPSPTLLAALRAMGQWHLQRGSHVQAEAVLRQAVLLAAQHGHEPACIYLLHALAAHYAGHAAQAGESLALASRYLIGKPCALTAPLLHYVRHTLMGDAAALHRARECILEQLSQFTDPQERAQFTKHVALHRAIEDAWQAQAAPSQITVRLARADAPLGRGLRPDELVSVRWTVDAGDSDRAILAQHGAGALRRRRLQRLIQEAQQQGAAPTHSELAAALQVNTRTIARDLAESGLAGTRRTREPNMRLQARQVDKTLSS